MDYLNGLLTETIESFSSSFLVMAERKTGLTDIAQMMDEADIRHIPIVENNKVIGLIAQEDLKLFQGKLNHHVAEDIMQTELFRVTSGIHLPEVIHIMHEKKFHTVVIENDKGEMAGIFTLADVLKIMKRILDQLASPRTIEVNAS